MTDDRLRIQLRHSRRADHDGGRAGVARVPAVRDARARPFCRRSRDDADAAFDLIDHHLEHPATLVVVQARDLTGHPEGGDAVDARRDEQVDDPPEAQLIEIAVRLKRRRQNGIDAFELQGSPAETAARGARVPGVLRGVKSAAPRQLTIVDQFGRSERDQPVYTPRFSSNYGAELDELGTRN